MRKSSDHHKLSQEKAHFFKQKKFGMSQENLTEFKPKMLPNEPQAYQPGQQNK